jgi:hypothetical protein
VFVAMQYAYELGLKGITALRSIMVVNGAPSIFGDLPLALVRKSGKLVAIKEILIDKNQKEIKLENNNLNEEVFGAICTTIRRDGNINQEHTTHFTVQDAKNAGLWGGKVWKVYPKRMLQVRCRSQNLKDQFSDVLSGVQILEYDFNQTSDTFDEKGATHGNSKEDKAKNFNQDFEEKS